MTTLQRTKIRTTPLSGGSPSLGPGCTGRPGAGAKRVVGDQSGQSTVEYALVLMGAAALAMLLISWATGTDVIGELFDTVFGGIIDGAR
jgi:hypothetical protein